MDNSNPKTSSPLKPVDTVEVAVAVLKLIKELGSIIALALMELARIKQKKAENRAAVAETELKVLQDKVAIDEQASKQSPDDIIDQHLAARKKSGG